MTNPRAWVLLVVVATIALLAALTRIPSCDAFEFPGFQRSSFTPKTSSKERVQNIASGLKYRNGATEGSGIVVDPSAIVSTKKGTEEKQVEKAPPLKTLRAWTQEYFDAMEAAGGMTSIYSYSQFLDDDEYVHTGPATINSGGFGPINKEDYVNLMKYNQLNGVDLTSIVQDFKIKCDGWHRDPHDPWKVWVVVRYSGTHVSTAKVATLGGFELELKPKNVCDDIDEYLLGAACDDETDGTRFVTGPEMHSYQWTPNKTIRWQTSGFIGDQYVGSNEGYGGLLGIMVSLGLPRAAVDMIGPLAMIPRWVSQFFVKSSGSGRAISGGPPPTQTRWSRLPTWWHESRIDASKNVRR